MYRLNDRGNHQLNHALHIAVTRSRTTRPAATTTPVSAQSIKEPLRALKRRISNASTRRRETLTRTWAREGNQGRLFNPAWPANP
jgi:hypothetical protein